MKLSNQPLEEERVKKQLFLDLELCILRLREMLSSIPLAVKKGDIQGNSELMEKINTKLKEKEAACPICYSELKFFPVVFTAKECKHIFCQPCMEIFCLKDKKCALCRDELDDDDSVFSSPFNCPDSTKADVMLNSLESKSLVISKFDRLLTWLESFLKDKGFEVHRIHGKMEAEEILEIAQMFQNSSSEKNRVLLASFKAISGEMDISSIHQVFFMEAVKENEENAVISHITGVKGKINEKFHGAFRLVVEDAIEGKIVGLKGTVEAGFKELNMLEIEKKLT
ncbi:unnamed protein product [Trifolium pratense]|uniref:Uncharacterized protein n=1 Tax=Trifolium pratense TaxID=57577 RepID=A0ACB0JCJ2_TRIPR|nr:unnamed protein product [Trifolium pratense]